MKRALFSALALLAPAALAAPAAAAQVAPNVVVIEDGERGAQLSVWNNGDTPVEVQVSLGFGYEDTDDDGTIETSFEKESDHPRSAADWLRAYPQRVVVPPEARQSIRVFARAPGNLDEGEYWARAQVQTRPTEVPAEDVEGEEDIRVRVGVTSRQRIPVFVRNGETESSLAVDRVRARLHHEATEGEDDGERYVMAHYRADAGGGAAFLGSMAARIESGGETLAARQAPLAVFVSGERRIRIPLPEGVSRADLDGARLDLEPVREHPVVQSRHIRPGESEGWQGPLALE